MKISPDKYEKIHVALDGIRCDNRENKVKDLRQIDDDVMQYIERKGYCRYILGENNTFIRTLTKKGYKVLSSGGYKAYLLNETKEAWKVWLPIAISLIAVFITALQYLENRDAAGRLDKLEKMTIRIDSSIRALDNKQHNSDSTLGQLKIWTLKRDSLFKALIKPTDKQKETKQ